MDLSAMQQKLRPCNMDSPFVFISYSANDKETVWADAAELQSRGYNIWIDEANLDKTKESWKSDALKAIEDYNCALVLFYVSAHSLVSEPCLNELEKTVAEETQETHLGKVDFVAIDAAPVGNIGEYIKEVGQQIERSAMTSAEKSQKTRVLYRFSTSWFPPNNEKVRIRPRSEAGRIGDYYADIEKELNRNRRELRLPPEKLKEWLSPEKLYRYAVESIMSGKNDSAKDILEVIAEEYAAAALLLAHQHYVGAPEFPQDRVFAASIWEEIGKYIPCQSWLQTGTDYDTQHFYSEALAYLLAYGEKHNHADSLYLASKIWLKKGSQTQAQIALRQAANLGSEKARVFLTKLYAFDEDKVSQYAYRDEAPVK